MDLHNLDIIFYFWLTKLIGNSMYLLLAISSVPCIISPYKKRILFTD